MRLPSKGSLAFYKTKWVVSHPVQTIIASFQSRKAWRTEPVLQFPNEVAHAVGRKRPRFDRFLSLRQPALAVGQVHDGRPRVVIDDMYPPEMEIRESPQPYINFAQILCDTGVFQAMKSIVDVGCATGHLISALQVSEPDLEVSGIEFFPYQKAAAPRQIRDKIVIHDMREPLKVDRPFDVVICTEVAEHIDPASIDVFLRNLQSLCSKRLVLTWSGTYPPPQAPPQHLSSLRRRDVQRLMSELGWELETTATRNALKALKQNLSVYPWWQDSFSVWRPPSSLQGHVQSEVGDPSSNTSGS